MTHALKINNLLTKKSAAKLDGFPTGELNI
jgi:hypothetical protein